MSRAAFHSRLAPLAAIAILICSAACTVPLAPGYAISKESREIQFVSGATPELKVRGQFTLVNSGTSKLNFIDVVVPVEKTFGFNNLRVEVNGHPVSAVPLPAELQYDHPHTLRIQLESTWEQKQKRELLIEYLLHSPDDSGSQITLSSRTFSLGFSGWFAVLQPPDHALSPFPARPDKTLITIRTPANFLVLSRGTKLGAKKLGDEMETRYMVRIKDLAPFAVGGQYVEASSSRRDNGSVVFWTLEPLKGDSAASVQQIESAWNTMQNDFGPLDKNIRGPHVVESPELHNHLTGETGPAAAAFPGGALVSSAAFALGINDAEFLDKVTHAIAHDWFGQLIYPAPFAALGLGEGLPEYATIVIDEASKGEAGRRERIVEYLHAYDEASKRAVEIPLGTAKLSDPPEQRAISLAKAPLFFIALEDKCGEAPVRAALKRVVSLLRGQQVGYNEIRSALEQESGKDLAELFRTWLYELGIPKDFSAKYQPANESRP
ncbi:MAG TPA: M1 family aminopeptidase [Candidatus Acidoferrales bacterium]